MRVTTDRPGDHPTCFCWRGYRQRNVACINFDAANYSSVQTHPAPPRPQRYHGTVILDPAPVGRDAGRIAEEVVTHLAGLVGYRLRVTLEIEAGIPGGAPDNVVRTVTENSRTLKFTSNSGFETE